MASRALSAVRRVAISAGPIARSACMPASRAFASKADIVPSKKGKEAKDLVSVIEREIQYEKEEDNSASNIKELADSMEGWTLTDDAGTARFAVSKQYGTQTIRIDVDTAPVPGEDEEEYPEGESKPEGEEEEGPLDGYRLVVTVTDAGKASVMQIGAIVTDHLRIHRATMYPTGKVPTADAIFGGDDTSSLYGGPDFGDLDPAMQNGFYEYLAARGVDDSLSEKLGDYAAAKEQAEYMRWLSVTKEFAAK